MNGDQNPSTPLASRPVTSGDNPPSLVEPSQSVAVPQAAQVIQPQVVAPQPTPAAPQAATPAPQVAAAPAPGTPEAGFYHPSDASAGPVADDAPYAGANGPLPQQNQANAVPAVSWTSSGDPMRTRSSSWLMKMVMVSVVIGGLVYLVTRDFVSSGAVLIAGVLFGVLGSRKPHPLSYELDSSGIVIGQKHFTFADFRAFSVAEDTLNVTLVPLKRFLPLMSVHLDAEQKDQIMAILSQHLPMEAHRRDAFDQITSKMRI